MCMCVCVCKFVCVCVEGAGLVVGGLRLRRRRGGMRESGGVESEGRMSERASQARG